MPNGEDNTQISLISQISASSLEDTMTIMGLELPLFTYASQFNISYASNVTSSGQTCLSFYQNVLQWPTTQS